MEDPKVRVEWRETPEQAQAALAVAGRWLARRHAVLAGAFALVALLALALPDWCARLAIALPFAWLSYAFGAAYRRRAPRVDSRAVRAWIESARGKHTEGFREAASEIDSGELAHVEVDREGVEVGRGAARTRLRWAAVRRFRVHRDGHVLFLGRAAPGLFVPAWAFGGDAERAMLLDHARALCAASAPAETSPPLPRSDDGFEVSAIASLTLARLQRGPSTFGSYVWWPLLGYVVGLGVTSALPLALQSVEVAALFAALPHLAAIASLLMTPWGLTLLAARSARRHRVHRVRFSERGVTWSSALWSGTRPWDVATLVIEPKRVVLDALALPRSGFDADQLGALSSWKSVAPPAERPPSSSHAFKILLLWLVLIAGFVAVYNLVTQEPPPEPPDLVAPIVEEIVVEPEPTDCPLAEPVILAGVVRQDDARQCAGLAEALPGPASIRTCVEVDARASAAVIEDASGRAAWIRMGRRWRSAGALVTAEMGLECEPTVSARAVDLVAGGAPEILFTMECTSGVDPGPIARRLRILSACGVQDRVPTCWWTIPIAMSVWAEGCLGWSVGVSAPAVDPTVVRRRGDPLALMLSPALRQITAPVPSGLYALPQLSAYDLRAERDPTQP